MPHYQQHQYTFIHHALSELVVCGNTEVAAANLRITTSKLEKTDNDGVTGFQKHFQVITVYETLNFVNIVLPLMISWHS